MAATSAPRTAALAPSEGVRRQGDIGHAWLRREISIATLPACFEPCSRASSSPSCSAVQAATSPIPGAPDATVDAPEAGVPEATVEFDGAAGHFCDLPGSIQYRLGGVVVVPGGVDTPDISYLRPPTGFCVHYYGVVGNARQLRFAPGGELFVASPTTPTGGGGAGGQSAIVVLPDDDNDGVADSVLTFLGSLPSTQGILFTGGFLYYQDSTSILRVPYATGDRSPSGASEPVANITIYSSDTHWPKTLDVADDGTIYVGNGGDQTETCDPSRPFHGGILKLDGTDGGAPVAKGLRNPIAIRCPHGHNTCLAAELGKDGSSVPDFGREKIIPIRQGDDWGFPAAPPRTPPTPVSRRPPIVPAWPASTRPSSSATPPSASTSSPACGRRRGRATPSSPCTVASAAGPVRAWSASPWTPPPASRSPART